MQKIKITFFNPETLKTRVTRFIFKWDYSNHCWNVTTVSLFGESSNKWTGSPMQLIEHYKECLIKKGEYATVKTFA